MEVNCCTQIAWTLVTFILLHTATTEEHTTADKVSSTITPTSRNEFDQTTVGDQETTERTTKQLIVNEVFMTKATTPEKVESTILSTTSKELGETTVPDKKSTITTTTPEDISTKVTTTAEKVESTLLSTTTKGLDETTVLNKESTIRTTTPQVITTKAATTATDKVESTPVSTTTEGLDTTTVKETTIRPTTPDNSVAEVCQTWTIWESSCYLFVSTSAPSWDAAAAQCLTYHDNAHLVFIGSASENDFVVQLAGSGKYPWIGLRDVGGGWVWSFQGTAADASLSYTNWESDYDDRKAGEDCGYLTTDNKKWQSHKCDDPDTLVCEIEQ